MKKIITGIYLKIKTIHLDDLVLVIVGIFLALLFRYFVRGYISARFQIHNKIWYRNDYSTWLRRHKHASFHSKRL